MSHKGKMSSSPFHVENQFYKYAIEHEYELAVCKKSKPTCAHFVTKGGKCSFPLSGYDLCNSIQCKYNCKSLRRKESCENCAYYLLKRCHHKKGDGNKDTTFATFCCFFKGPADKKYRQIRQELLAEMEKSVIGRWDSVISYPGLRVGDSITHISFGLGEITYLNRASKSIRVSFPIYGEKPFVFPDAIEKGYLLL